MNYDQMMAELRAEYMETLPQRLTDIETHLKTQDFENLHNDFHKLKGSGKTYGIPEISELAEVFEKLCITHPKEALILVPAAIQTLRSVHASRLQNKAFDIQAITEFQTARQILKRV